MVYVIATVLNDGDRILHLEAEEDLAIAFCDGTLIQASVVIVPF